MAGVDRQVSVLIVDDSMLFRELISRGLQQDPALVVVGAATDPFEAIELISRWQPDVLICDIQMPRLDGISFIRQLMPQHPLPIIVVSSVRQAVFEALEAGAVEFVMKPGMADLSDDGEAAGGQQRAGRLELDRQEHDQAEQNRAEAVEGRFTSFDNHYSDKKTQFEARRGRKPSGDAGVPHPGHSPRYSYRMELFVNELIHKTKTAAYAQVHAKPAAAAVSLVQARMVQHHGNEPKLAVKNSLLNASACQVIAIGASTGGTEAIAKLLLSLPPTLPGIVIVQHIPPVFSRLFAERLNSLTDWEVKEAETGDLVRPGRVLIAPGNWHMRLRKSLAKAVSAGPLEVECFYGERLNGHCPSIDVLFQSVAQAAGNKSIGVLLTGMGTDGAKGLLAMRQHGARTLGQDEQSSIVYGMPKAAFAIGAVERQVSLDRLPDMLIDLL